MKTILPVFMTKPTRTIVGHELLLLLLLTANLTDPHESLCSGGKTNDFDRSNDL